MKTFKRLLFVVVLGILFSSSSSAQCQCNLKAEDNSVGTYNVGPNYVLCISSGLTYTGTINLNGGTLCNNGTISKINFNSGTLENYGQYIKTGNLSIQNSGNITINSHSGSVFRITGNLDIQSGNINTVTTVNLLEGKSTFEIQGSFNTSKGILAMNPKTKEKLFTEGVFINIGKDFYVGGNAGLIMNIGQGTYFNVNKSASFDGKYNKTINNYGGVININSDFNIAGNGQNTGVFNLMNTNKGSLVIKKSFNAAYNNGTVNITNYASMDVGKTWTQSKDVTNVLNYGKLSITQDLNIERGSFTNNYMLTARDGDVKFGTFTNNYYTNFTRDLITSYSSAIINNNSYLLVNREFNNIATINLAEKSTIETLRYYNLNNGIINGSPSVPDTLSFARIYISGYSENKGYLNNTIIVYDRTLQYTTSNAGFGFDIVGNTNRIGSSIVFANRLPINIGPPMFNCLLTNFIYSITALALPSQVCAGVGTVQLSSQLNSIVFIGGSISYQPVLSTPVNSYTWSPAASFANPVGKVQTISSPNITTSYIVKVKIANCTIQKSVVVNIIVPTLVTINSNQNSNCLSSTLLLSSNSVSGALSYQWYNTLVPIAGANTISYAPVEGGSYYLQVSSSNGCISKSNIINIQSCNDYAVLKKELDGSFYNINNGQLLFTIKGDYSKTSLNYKIYNSSRASYNTLPINSNVLENGDNRFIVNVSTLPTGYYILEVFNQKAEKLLLRFKK